MKRLIIFIFFISLLFAGCYTEVATREVTHATKAEKVYKNENSDTLQSEYSYEDNYDDDTFIINNYYYGNGFYHRYFRFYQPSIYIGTYFGSYAYYDDFYYDPYFYYPSYYPIYYYYPAFIVASPILFFDNYYYGYGGHYYDNFYNVTRQRRRDVFSLRNNDGFRGNGRNSSGRLRNENNSDFSNRRDLPFRISTASSRSEVSYRTRKSAPKPVRGKDLLKKEFVNNQKDLRNSSRRTSYNVDSRPSPVVKNEGRANSNEIKKRSGNTGNKNSRISDSRKAKPRIESSSGAKKRRTRNPKIYREQSPKPKVKSSDSNSGRRRTYSSPRSYSPPGRTYSPPSRPSSGNSGESRRRSSGRSRK